MYIEMPDPHPGRCRNYRYVGNESYRCLDYDNRPHVCRFPEYTISTTSGTGSASITYTIPKVEPKPWVAPGDEQPYVVDSRDPQCIERWPECRDGDFNPACCRWPKSCSCGGAT